MLPKPFVLLPPLDQQSNYQPGETFQCELTLFANATQHIAIVQAAVEYLGGQLGLGYNRGKFKILDLKDETYQTKTQYFPSNPQYLSLDLVTRLRLKSDGQLQKTFFPFSLLIARLLGRLKTLQQIYHPETKAVDPQNYQQLMQQAQTVTTLNTASMYWDDWSRYSGRQKEWMKFGGLLGSIHFQGNLQPFIPYLQMGEWSHIGGKSSFGLGKYTINYGETT